MSKSLQYMLLFPGLGVFCFNLLVLGGVSLPSEFDFFGRTIHELESLTYSGGKSLANLAEIYVALAIGITGCLIIGLKRPQKLASNSWKLVSVGYLLVLFLYLVIPALPE